MEPSATIAATERTFQAHDLVTFGRITIPDLKIRFGFQLDIVPSLCPGHLLFGLVGPATRPGDKPIQGFVVRLNTETGEIWDALNDAGLVGWVEHPLGMKAFTDEEPLLLSWEVEHTGSALIPRLCIAGEEWLYPSIHCEIGESLDTIAGCRTEEAEARQLFLHPALWREQLQ